MNAVLGRMATAVERVPAVALAILIALTGLLGVFAAQQQADTDLTAFAPESDLARAHERIAAEFGTAGASVQVVVDAGDGGNVLSRDGLAAAQAVAEAATATPEVAALLPDADPEAPPVVSFALPFTRALAQQGLDPSVVGATPLDAAVGAVLADPTHGVQAGALLSDDLDAEAGAARAGLVIVRLDGGVEASRYAEAELALAAALSDIDASGFSMTAFGEHILADALLTGMATEMPILLGIAFLLILAILFVTYRRVSDVLLGLAGLVITVVWTFGIAVLLGPGYLGITGVMSQISIMIPVLLIGLAIDFAIHLTARYREEISGGRAPARAAHGAIVSVGGALVLATVTTMVGFLTNVVSPLPPMRDFGLFVAGGVLSAFVVMVLLVPAARSLLDRRRHAAGGFDPGPTGADRGLGRLMVRAAVLAERHPARTLVAAAAVTLLAGVAGSQVSTTFDQDDFVPPDSEIAADLAMMQELFGGDVDETTSVLLDGDVATPAATNALLAVHADLADTAGVRRSGGQAQVDSPVGVLLALAAEPQVGDGLLALGFDPVGLAPDADVPAMYDLARQAAPQLVAAVLNDEETVARLAIATSAGQPGAVALRDELRADVAPLEDAGLQTTVVSEFLLFEESLDALSASQTRGIAITLVVALLVLVGYFGVRERRPLLGVITMLPSALVVAWVAGSMWLLGLSFNVMTAMVASLAIGIGVPYGIHVTNRFTEDLAISADVDEAIRRTVVNTGGALVGSAVTTAAGFGVLAFASLVPIRQFGIITALTIGYSLIAAVVIEPATLKLWAERRSGPGPGDSPPGSKAPGLAGAGAAH